MTTTQPADSVSVTLEGAVSVPAADAPDLCDRIAPYVLFALALGVYVRTLCPTIFTDDCGEIATAIITGGVMHPPGYPLYSLLGRLFVHALPFGEPAWRIGLISALAAAGACAAAYRLARMAGARPVWSIAAAGVFAFSPALWRQATKVETYSLNALFVAVILIAAAKYARSGRPRDLMIFALCCGLALTNHPAAVCAIVGAAWLVAARLWCESDRLALGIRAVAVGLSPLCLYGLIWLWAAHDPGGQIWGDPDTPHRFLLQVTAARYRVYMTDQSWSGAAQRDLVDLPALLWRNLGWFLVGIVPGAARGLWARQTRAVNIAIAITLALYFVETSLYGILNIFEYYTPIILMLCIWGGIGADAIVTGIASRVPAVGRVAPTIAVGVCAAICLGSIMAHWSVCDRHSATYLRNLAEQTLESMPPHAVLISVGDNRNFPLWYVQDVLGIRRDVAVIPRSMLSGLGTPEGRAEMGWLLAKLQRQHPRLVDAKAILAVCARSPQFAADEGPTWRIAATAMAQGRPVLLTDVLPGDVQVSLYSHPIFTPLGPNLTTEAYGLTTLIVRTDRLPSIGEQNRVDQQVVATIPATFMPDALMEDEPDGNIVNETYSQMLLTAANLSYRARGDAVALAEMRAAAALDPTAENYDTLGSMYEMTRIWPQAINSFRTAVALDPGDGTYADDLRNALEMETQIGPDGARVDP